MFRQICSLQFWSLYIFAQTIILCTWSILLRWCWRRMSWRKPRWLSVRWRAWRGWRVGGCWTPGSPGPPAPPASCWSPCSAAAAKPGRGWRCRPPRPPGQWWLLGCSWRGRMKVWRRKCRWSRRARGRNQWRWWRRRWLSDWWWSSTLTGTPGGFQREGMRRPPPRRSWIERPSDLQIKGGLLRPAPARIDELRLMWVMAEWWITGGNPGWLCHSLSLHGKTRGN